MSDETRLPWADDYIHGMQAEIDRLRAEIERLTEALEEIEDTFCPDPGSRLDRTIRRALEGDEG